MKGVDPDKSATTFLIAAFDGPNARIIVLSNHLQTDHRQPFGTTSLAQPTAELLCFEGNAMGGALYVIGSGAPFIQDDVVLLSRLARRLPNDRHGDNAVFEQLEHIIRAAARRSSASGDNSVSEGCLLNVIRADGRSGGRVCGVPGADYAPPWTSQMLDSAQMLEIVKKLQSETLIPQAAKLHKFTQDRVANTRTRTNQQRKEELLIASTQKMVFNSRDALAIDGVVMTPFLQGHILAQSSDPCVAIVIASAAAVDDASCTPSVFEIHARGEGHCTITFSDGTRSSETNVIVTRSIRRAYIPNSGSNDVSVIDTEQHTVIATVPVGANPTAVVVHPTAKRCT